MMTEGNEKRAGKQKPRWHLLLLAVLFVGVAVGASNLYLLSKLANVEQQQNKERWFWELGQPGYSDEDRRKALAELYWIGNTEWRSARLERLDLTGIQLARADIQNAWMNGCKLTRADLTSVVLRQTKLRQSDLSEAVLTGAVLFEADLLKSNLQDAVFDHADLRGASLDQSNASRSSFINADLSAARMELIQLHDADLQAANLSEADLRLADLSRANLLEANLSNANLDQVILRDSNWWRAEGLTSTQIKSFAERFPPTEDAPESVRKDFEAWSSEGER